LKTINIVLKVKIIIYFDTNIFYK